MRVTMIVSAASVLIIASTSTCRRYYPIALPRESATALGRAPGGGGPAPGGGAEGGIHGTSLPKPRIWGHVLLGRQKKTHGFGHKNVRILGSMRRGGPINCFARSEKARHTPTAASAVADIRPADDGGDDGGGDDDGVVLP